MMCINGICSERKCENADMKTCRTLCVRSNSDTVAIKNVGCACNSSPFHDMGVIVPLYAPTLDFGAMYCDEDGDLTNGGKALRKR